SPWNAKNATTTIASAASSASLPIRPRRGRDGASSDVVLTTPPVGACEAPPSLPRSSQAEYPLDPHSRRRREALLQPLVGDTAIDLRERRICVDDAGQLFRVHSLRDGEHVFGDQLAGVRADDRCAEQPSARIGDDLREALGLAFGARAVDVVERKPIDT